MKELLTHYSVGEIILFIFLLAIAAKEIIQLIDWFKSRARQAIEEKDKPEELAAVTQKHDDQLKAIRQQLNVIKQNINLLLESDKDDIKQSITKEHHYFCYKVGSIDDYSLDCMERRYLHYTDEGGNSFVKTLMEEVRALPRKLDKDNI